MIELKNLTKIYHSNGASAVGLKGVSVSFNKGEFVGVVGPSGSGKTTLLNVVTGMDTYEEGELFLFGKDTSGYSKEDFEMYRRNNVSFIFQNYQLIDSYTVLDNVVLELLFKGVSKSDATTQATEILNKVGLSHRLKNKASKLSGGEKQRVVIARALASDCQILACDEPTGNLDSTNSIEIINLLKEISKDKLVLFVTHDTELLNDVATRILTIKDGEVFNDENNKTVEELEVVECTQKKVDFKTNLYVAMKNIVSTPKKSIMLFFVFLITCIYIIVNTNAITFDFSNSFKMRDLYTNTTKNRVIVYGDVDYNKGIEIENDYFLDEFVYLYIDNPLLPTTASDYYYSVLTTDVYVGRLPESSNEIVIGINEMFMSLMTEDVYGEILRSGMVVATINEVDYKVVGVVSEEDFFTSKVYFYNNVVPTFETSLGNDTVFYKDMVRTSINRDYSMDDFLITIPHGTDYSNLSVKLGDLEVPITSDNVKYGEDYVLNSRYVYDFSLNNVYRSSFIFDDEFDAKEAFNYFSKEGYTTLYPDSFKYDQTLLYYIDVVFAAISLVSNTISLIFIIIIISVIAYLILKTSVKDFTIMRIIGLNKKDVYFILMFQVMFILLIATLTSIGIIGVLSATPLGSMLLLNSTLKNLTIPSNAIKTIVLLTTMGISVATIQHKKMFKSSASSNLRGGDLL